VLALHTPPIPTRSSPFTAGLGLVSLQVEAGPPVVRPWKGQKVVDYGDGDEDGLRNLRAIDSGQVVGAVGGECGEVDIIQRT